MGESHDTHWEVQIHTIKCNMLSVGHWGEVDTPIYT